MAFPLRRQEALLRRPLGRFAQRADSPSPPGAGGRRGYARCPLRRFCGLQARAPQQQAPGRATPFLRTCPYRNRYSTLRKCWPGYRHGLPGPELHLRVPTPACTAAAARLVPSSMALSCRLISPNASGCSDPPQSPACPQAAAYRGLQRPPACGSHMPAASSGPVISAWILPLFSPDASPPKARSSM